MNWREHPDCPPAGTYLCRVDEVPDGGGWEVTFGEGKENFKVLLLRAGDQVWAYRNLCPHFSLPLNFHPQTFVTLDGLVMCAHHTAFFNFEDGACVDGPCGNAGLTSLPSHQRGNSIHFGPAED